MWNIQSTTELLKNMSAATEPDKLLRLFIDHIRRSVHVERVLVLTRAGVMAPQYRIVRSITWDADKGGVLTEPAEVRQGGLLARLLYAGSFQNIADLSPEASEPDFDLLRDSRSLIAFPLFEKGVSTGMVVMLGPSPHTCSTTDLCGLAMMGDLLDRAIHAQTLARQLESTCRELDCELQAAADVQRWLLPPSTPVVANTGIATWYQTARHCGGDYYDLDEMPDGRLGVLIADVSGKGAAAAVLMVVLRTIVHETAWSRVTSPAALLDYADTRLCELGLPQRGVFTTAFSCALDPVTGALTYSSAGHNPPRLLRAKQRTVLSLDRAGTTPLGMLDQPRTHTEETVVLMPGDLVVLYTDGITEAMSPEGDIFGMDRLDKILRTLPEPITPALAVEAVARAVGQFAGDRPLSDDQTLLVLGRRAQPGEPAYAAADTHDAGSRTTGGNRTASHETITMMPTQPDIRSLIERSTAYFQPIVDLNTGQVLGAETLVRFVNPDGTLRGPGGIIERVEENLDDLEALTWRLFRSIAKEMKPLFERHRRFYVSVNVPPVILGSPRLKYIFEDSGLTPYIDRMVCEITERQALTDFGREVLAIVRPLGLRIAIDDFGTGHSSLKQLIGLPLDILKIDRSEVVPLMKEPTADRLLRGIVALAAALRVKVTAEGVETRQQAFFLHAAGVDAGQGWLWSKAVAPDELERLMESGFSEHSPFFEPTQSGDRT